MVNSAAKSHQTPVQGPAHTECSYTFLNFTLDLATERLVGAAGELKLRPKSFLVMRYLAEHNGRLVTRDELMQAIWGDVAVNDEAITKCIADIRRALGDDSQNIVRTVTRRGFLFEAKVHVIPSLQSRQRQGVPLVTPPRHGWTSRHRFPLAAMFMVAIALSVGVILFAWLQIRHKSVLRFAAIAVLPFESLSSDVNRQLLSDGMTEALITDLGEVSPVRVIARTSVNQYQGTKKPIQQIARELNVDAVVEGTIAQSGERVRVTANLIQVSPEKHLWAHSYERQFSDALALQDEIAESIAAEIQGKVAPPQQEYRETSHAVNPEAQIAFWKAEYLMNNAKVPGDIRKVVEYSEQAVRLDPSYAPAQAVLSTSYFWFASTGLGVPKEITPRARMAAERAIALDDRLAYGHFALGSILLIFDRNWVGAEREARRAISLNPSEAQGHILLANYLAAEGRTDEAVIEAKHARDLDPLSFFMHWMLGRLLCLARRYNESLAELRHAEDMQPHASPVQIWMFKSYWMKGQFEEAIATDLRLRRDRDGLSAQSLNALQAAYSQNGSTGYWMKLRQLLLPEFGTNPTGCYRLAEINTYLGDKEEAFRYLQKAYDEHTDWIPFLKVDPTLDPLRSDPRFQALLRGMGLSP